MGLSKRMQMVSSLVSDGHTIADIGTDHAYVPIYLVRQGHIPGAIAMDINPGPLEKARKNICVYGLENRIDTRLSDGLEKLNNEEVETIVIAGMGGDLMTRILTEGAHALSTPKELILQPQSEWEKVRHWLHDNGYRIRQEEMLKEDGKYYMAMKAVFGDQAYEHEFQYYFGDMLLRSNNPILKEYLIKENTTYTRIVLELQQSEKLHIKERAEELTQYVQYIKEALECYGVS